MTGENEIVMLYKLSKNESLQGVAKKFQISPQILASKNHGITFNAGTTIVIPKLQGLAYKVEIGDTIDSICEKFQLSKSQFLEKNSVNFVYHGMIVSV